MQPGTQMQGRPSLRRVCAGGGWGRAESRAATNNHGSAFETAQMAAFGTMTTVRGQCWVVERRPRPLFAIFVITTFLPTQFPTRVMVCSSIFVSVDQECVHGCSEGRETHDQIMVGVVGWALLAETVSGGSASKAADLLIHLPQAFLASNEWKMVVPLTAEVAVTYGCMY